MLAEEIARDFRVYMDEPDLTFVDAAQLAVWLEKAYDDFRALVTEIDPYVYARSQAYSLSAVRKLDLSAAVPPILGSTATNRMYQLTNIYQIESTALPDNILRLLEPNALPSTYDLRADYTLKGAEIFFTGEVSMDIRVDYIPESAINWATASVVGANVYVDDLNRFHDIIALLAYLQYAIVDSADNAQLLAVLGRRQKQLRAYLENRSGGLVERVTDVGWM